MSGRPTKNPSEIWKVQFENGTAITIHSKIRPGGAATKIGKAKGYGSVKHMHKMTREVLQKPTPPKEHEENGHVAVLDVNPVEEYNSEEILQSEVYIDKDEDDKLINIICDATDLCENILKRLEKLLDFCSDSSEIFDSTFLASFTDGIGVKATAMKEKILDIIMNLEGE